MERTALFRPVAQSEAVSRLSDAKRTLARLREINAQPRLPRWCRLLRDVAARANLSRETVSPAKPKPDRKPKPKRRPAADETERIVGRLRELLGQGKSIRQAARILKRPRSTLHSLAVRHHIARNPPRQLEPKKARTLKRFIREAKLSTSAMARKLKLNKATVSRAQAKQLDEETPDCTFKPRSVRGRRCPEHGMVKFWPCVACAALKATQ